jgi:hypothetical protein
VFRRVQEWKARNRHGEPTGRAAAGLNKKCENNPMHSKQVFGIA